MIRTVKTLSIIRHQQLFMTCSVRIKRQNKGYPVIPEMEDPSLFAKRNQLNDPLPLSWYTYCMNGFVLCQYIKKEALSSFIYGIRQRPILPGRLQPSTFGTEGLNFCVRDGNRWNPFVMTTGNRIGFSQPSVSALSASRR